MVHVIYPILCLAVLVLFLKRRPYLAPVEVVAVYLFSTILYMVTVAAVSITMFLPELLKTSTEYRLMPYIVLNRMLVYPLLLTLFVNWVQGKRSWTVRAGLYVLWVGVLTGIAWLNDYFAILLYIKWTTFDSLIMWAVMLLVPVGFAKWFQSLRRKDLAEV
ncbi:hypothetical protein CBW65_14880 [Tumebacillus avium]|uniref:Uncharacterized protein n=1 Tax=Tumebacillus avium TaxID=1903704 RepID=A0A1Y0IPC0_9BACL|nr:hypothetical protein [Tumebacillus avium]ARU62140.1 hypothetical protein CBW65_14880 [Tumebacillus avium]